MILLMLTIINLFSLSKTQNYMSQSSLMNKKQSKTLSKGFERSVYLNEHKRKSEKKIHQIEFILNQKLEN